MDRIQMGARKSPLSLAQVALAQAWLSRFGSFDFSLWAMETTGDTTPGPLHAVGGKGLFTKELLEHLASGQIECAVHSLKDVEVSSEQEFPLVTFLPREDPRDVLISLEGYSLETLPQKAVIGTVSPRRQALLHILRPDCRTLLLRGNVGSRLAKLEQGGLDAIILAAAGLKRLNRLDERCHFLETDRWIPAAGQGIVVIQTHRSKTHRFAHTSDPLTEQAARAERQFLQLMNGGCQTPTAAHASTLDGVTWQLSVLWGSQFDQCRAATLTGGDPLILAEDLARQMKNA